MTKVHKNFLNFMIVKAPLDAVTAAAGGVLRADANGVTLGNDVTQPDLLETTPKGRYGLRKRALVAPIGDAVLVEFCYMHDLALGVSMILPDVEVLSFRSNWETKSRGFDRFSVIRAGKVTRKLDIDLGWESTRIDVLEEGPLHPIEQRPEDRPRSKRKWLDQDALLDMADRAAPGVRAAIETRGFPSHVSMAGYSSLDSLRDDLSQERSTKFQKEYETARRLGIGDDEKQVDEMQSQNDWIDHIEAVRAYAQRFETALRTAMPEPQKVRAVYDRLLQDPTLPAGYVPYGFAHGLDRTRDPKNCAYLEGEQILWRHAEDLNNRIRQTIWAVPGYENHILFETDDVPARAVRGLHAGTYDDIAQAVRVEASQLLQSAGITFQPDDKILSKADAETRMAGHLLSSSDDFKRQVHGDITSDLEIGMPRAKK